MSTFAQPRRSFAVLAVLGFTTVTALVGCGSSKSSTTASTPPATPGAGATTTAGATAGPGKITIKNYTFIPTPLTVTAGTTVTWTNTDAFEHEITENNALFAGPNIKPGATFSYKFDKPGTYPYHCGIHNYMTGTVTVT